MPQLRQEAALGGRERGEGAKAFGAGRGARVHIEGEEPRGAGHCLSPRTTIPTRRTARS